MGNKKLPQSHARATLDEGSIGEWVDRSALTPWKKNPRKNKHAIKPLAEAIERMGFGAPIVARKLDGRVIAGHTRLLAAESLGMDRVPVRWVDVDDRTADMMALADNKLGELAEWDEPMLMAELGELGLDDAALAGWDSKELDALARNIDSGEVTEDEAPGEDRAEELRQKYGVEKGQLWQLGDHRILCGDSTNAGDVERVTGGKCDLCLTDPPYGLGDSNTEKNNYIEHDDTKENLVALIGGFFPLARRVAAVAVMTPGNANTSLYPPPTWTMAWFTPAGSGSGPWGFCCWQPILCFGKDPKLSNGEGRHHDAIVHTESSEKLGHPCAKPIGFWCWLLERCSSRGDAVYEPFSGSGTTIIACEQLGRKCRAIELSPGYVAIAIERWAVLTGKEPVLLS